MMCCEEFFSGGCVKDQIRSKAASARALLSLVARKVRARLGLELPASTEIPCSSAGLRPAYRACLELNPVSSSPTERTIVVLGLARGGTSLIAGLLRILGIDMGDQLAQGIHEDLDFVGDNLQKIRSAISIRNRSKPVWGWKSTSNIEVLPRVFPLLRNPQVICITRDILPIAARNMHEGTDVRMLLRHQLSHYQWLLYSSMSLSCPVLLVSYEKARSGSDEIIMEIARFTGRDPSPEVLERARQFISSTYSNIYSYNALTPSQEAAEAELEDGLPGEPVRILPYSNVMWRDDMYFSMGNGFFQLIFPDSTEYPGEFVLCFDLESAGSHSGGELIFDFGEGLVAEPKISLASLRPGRNAFRFSLCEKPRFVRFEFKHESGHYLIDNFLLRKIQQISGNL